MSDELRLWKENEELRKERDELKRQIDELCYEMETYEHETETVREVKAKLSIAMRHWKFTHGCAENSLRPDDPVHKGLDPMFYHTLTYEGDCDLVRKCLESREALARIEEVGK